MSKQISMTTDMMMRTMMTTMTMFMMGTSTRPCTG